jgi:hypothetical protein
VGHDQRSGLKVCAERLRPGGRSDSIRRMSPEADMALKIGIAVAGIGLTTYLAWAKRDLWRPRLRLFVGIGAAVKGVPMRWDAKVETVLLGGSIPDGLDAFVPLTYWLHSRSGAIKSVNVVMQYPSHFAVEQNDELLPPDGDAKWRINLNAKRQVGILGDAASSALDVGMIRIKEGTGTAEALRFVDHPSARARTRAYWERRDMAQLYDKFAKIPGFVDAVVVDIFVRSENHNEIKRSVNVIWFNVNTIEKLTSKLDPVNAAIWRGLCPEPGRYWIPWPLKLCHTRYVEMYLLGLQRFKSAKGRDFHMAGTEHRGMNFAEIYAPVWAYREDSAIPSIFAPFVPRRVLLWANSILASERVRDLLRRAKGKAIPRKASPLRRSR